MNLQQPGQVWDRLKEIQRNEEIRRADQENHKRGRDIDVAPGRLLLTSPDGTRWQVDLDNAGGVSFTSLEDPPVTASPGGGGGATDLGYTASTRVLTSSTGADVTLPLVGSDPGLMAAADKTFLDGVQAQLDGKEATIAPLAIWDWWYDARLGTTGATALDVFAGVAVASGTNTTAIPAAAVLGYNPFGVFLRSSTTANGGYRYQTTSLVADYFGVISHKFRCQFLWRTDFTGRTVRMGYHDTATVTDAVDGAYFEVIGATASAKTANNSTRTTNATTATLSLDVPYTFEIDVNAAGTSARFRIYSGTNTTPVLDVTNTANIPTTSARAFGAGIVATEASTTASDIGILYSLGMGTVAGFERARG
jgi:hypothetical protein